MYHYILKGLLILIYSIWEQLVARGNEYLTGCKWFLEVAGSHCEIDHCAPVIDPMVAINH